MMPYRLFFLIALLLPGMWAQAQDNIDPPRASLVAYECLFDPSTNSSTIRAVLTGTNGLPIALDTVQPTVAVAGTTTVLPPEQISKIMLPLRPPLQMIIVLDITSTVPIEQIVNAVSTRLMPQLNVEDQVALITFSGEVAPVTQFYTDKNRLINEHMIDLPTLDGDNQLYGAIDSAVKSFPFNSPFRKVVLVLTDSGQRSAEQPQIESIIADAVNNQVQIYPIGFYTRDVPDVPVLQQLANGTSGFGWYYTEIRNSRASIEEAVGQFLNRFVQTLNSEIQMNVNMQGLVPDATGHVLLNLNLVTPNDGTLITTVRCPLTLLNHAIRFINPPIDNTAVNGQFQFSVAVESDLSPDLWRVVFLRDDVEVQNSSNTIYTFDAAQVQPGYHTVGAQLRNQSGQVLATTATAVRVYTQQRLQLTLGEGAVSPLSGVVRMEVNANPGFVLQDARFQIARLTDPRNVQLLGTRPFQGSQAVLVDDNIYQTVSALFPSITAQDQFQITVIVPGLPETDPPLAFSNELVVSLVTPDEPVIEAPQVVEAPPVDLPWHLLPATFGGIAIPRWSLASLAGGLLILNFILFQVVRRRRIDRLIHNVDRHDLSPQLMAITLRRGDMKQSFTLTKKTFNIGRGSTNDINLGDDPNISRQHGVVMWRKKGWYYSNRKGPNVTRIDGKRYRGLVWYRLEAITEMEIGQNLLIFHSNAQQDLSDFIKTNL